jgi:hypothetical protein
MLTAERHIPCHYFQYCWQYHNHYFRALTSVAAIFNGGDSVGHCSGGLNFACHYGENGPRHYRRICSSDQCAVVGFLSDCRALISQALLFFAATLLKKSPLHTN